jgi:glycosidase
LEARQNDESSWIVNVRGPARFARTKRVVRRALGAFFVVVSLTGVSSLAGPACTTPIADSSAPRRPCGLRIWHKPATDRAHVDVVGDWNGWKRPGTPLERQEDGWRALVVDVPPGEHAYALVEDGVWLPNRNEPMLGEHDGREVTVAVAEDCARPAVSVEKVETRADGHATVHATFVSGIRGAVVAPQTISALGRDGSSLSVSSIDVSRGVLIFDAPNLTRGKYTYRLEGRDTDGVAAEPAYATVWIDERAGTNDPWRPEDAIVYHAMVDRFRGPHGPLAPPPSPSARAGGTLSGIRAALDAGEFEKLGINTLWLSPLYANPTGEFLGNDGRPYSSYHGYWPIDSRAIDPRFASETELDAFMTSAHAKGIRVLFDVVPNHVHEQHPWVREHPDWLRRGCICGQGSCDWGANIRTCSFASYLPDIDWTKTNAALATTDDVLWWLDRWDADGLRVDAVPMMPRAAVRRITATARRRYAHPGNALYVLGENFTSKTGFQTLRYDLGPSGLDGSFHFPLMWTLRDAIALESAPLSAIAESFQAGEKSWEGADATMGLIIGNHDVSRFASVSAGSDSGDSWSSPKQPLDPIVYEKQRLALAAMFTLPGAPVLYYGDEVGLAGRGDPDCRRVMPSEQELSDEQRQTRTLAQRLGQVRACSRTLRRGRWETRLAEDERLVYARELDADVVVVSLSRRPKTAVTVAIRSPAPTEFVDLVTGDRAAISGGTLTLPADRFGVHVFVDAQSPCVATK